MSNSSVEKEALQCSSLKPNTVPSRRCVEAEGHEGGHTSFFLELHDPSCQEPWSHGSCAVHFLTEIKGEAKRC